MTLSRVLGKPAATAVATGVVLGVVGFGIVLRMARFAANRSLWLDEVMLALNIVNRSFIELTQPLSNNQAAPPGFLFIEKFLIQVLGDNEFVLRLFPLAAGIASLLAMYKVASIYLGRTGTLVAVGLFAVSEKLIYYASEVKQYSSDTLISLLLLFLAYKCLKTKTDPKHYIALMAGGAVSMWTSHPALFVLVGVSSGLALDQLLRQDRRRLSWLGMVFLVWMINAVILYHISWRLLVANAGLVGFWRGAFMPMPPWQEPAWVLNAFLGMFQNPVGLVDLSTAIGMAVFLVGCISFFFRKWQLALILIVPFPVTLLASGLEEYPFIDRLLLFIVPIVLLLIGEGIERIRALLLNVNYWVALSVCLITGVVLLYGPINLAVEKLGHPDMREHIRPVIAYIRQHKLDTDFIYVYYAASPAFSYYAPSYGFMQSDYSIGISSRKEPTRYIEDLDRLNTYRRVWFVFSHNCGWCTVDEEAYFLKHLDNVGTRIDEFRASDASVYLYSFDSSER